MDILLGAFAQQELYKLSTDELNAYSLILKQNDKYLYDLITGKLAVPDELNCNTMTNLINFAVNYGNI
jgi:succinate dehydrogenase flavin-adding protein (antitoxin of CptAB toxin-antitoxin module)